MSWIEPLSLETWIVNVFAGDLTIFSAIAVIVISGLAGYFRMNGVSFALMLGLFFIMFQGWIAFELYFILIAVGSILIGLAISQVVKN